MYWAKLTDMDSPVRHISVFPNFILKWSGFLHKTTFVHFEPKQILTFIF